MKKMKLMLAGLLSAFMIASVVLTANAQNKKEAAAPAPTEQKGNAPKPASPMLQQAAQNKQNGKASRPSSMRFFCPKCNFSADHPGKCVFHKQYDLVRQGAYYCMTDKDVTVSDKPAKCADGKDMAKMDKKDNRTNTAPVMDRKAIEEKIKEHKMLQQKSTDKNTDMDKSAGEKKETKEEKKTDAKQKSAN